MMSDELKSAYELAMERFRAREEAPQALLTEVQKQQIAAIRKEFQARRAEHELTLRTAIERARQRGDLEKLEQLEADDRRERERLDEQESIEVQKIRDQQ
jgi:hypothetical protein